VNSEVGFGVMTTKGFEKGEPVLVYVGDLIDSRARYEVLKRRYGHEKKGNYLFGFMNFRNKMHWLVYNVEFCKI
jgi:hypothetical protein